MQGGNILIVDDEPDLCEILHYNLVAAGYGASIAHSAEDALVQLQERRQGFDLLLLDVMMPGMSGFALAEQLGADAHLARIPIIFLTARDSEEDMLRGFDAGADDYIRKPFSIREVMARIKAVLGRRSIGDAPLRHDGLELNLQSKRVYADGEEVVLTRTEQEVLRLLLSHRGQVFSRQEILDRVWPRHIVVTDRTVDVNIARLRKKIGRYGRCIVCRPGYGYIFES